MAQNTYERLRSLVLSAVDLKQMMGWPDAMIEDYLTLIEGLIELANTIDAGSGYTANVQRSILYQGIKTDYKTLSNFSVVTNNTTTFGNQTIICNNTSLITVTLNATPQNFEEVYIKRANKELVISGNGRLIDGSSTVKLILKYVGLHLVYTTETNSWLII